MIRVVVLGAGGFGRETLDVIDAINSAGEAPQVDVVGVVDSFIGEGDLRLLRERGTEFLGSDEAWLSSGDDARFIIGIGDPVVRQRIDAAYRHAGCKAATAIVHPLAGIGSGVTLGDGAVVCAGVQISTNVTLGRHVHINPNATIGHDSQLGDFVSINPAGIVSGKVVIDRGVLVGAGAVILQMLRVGEFSIVGASACVLHDVPPNTTVRGVPAK